MPTRTSKKKRNPLNTERCTLSEVPERMRASERGEGLGKLVVAVA